MISGQPRFGLEGRQLGRYRLRHKLADGGMASVYLAQITGDRGFERWVAVKVVHAELSEDPEYATMLADEARLIARVHHPNVCSVMDFGAEDGRVYMVMEYLHGESLSAMVKRAWAEERSFPAWLAARAVADAALGLHAAHELVDANGDPLDIVHRDISPENVLVTYDGPAKVIDFGVVRAKGRMTKTRDGQVKGKLSYMAPEQLMSRPVDRRADVWSLGVVLWEATLGRRLFRGSTHADTVKRVVQDPIPRPSEITEHYPPLLERIVMGALERDVAQRTPGADVIAQQLEQYLHSLGRPAGHVQVGRWMRQVFGDRLLVREGLLHAPPDSGPLPVEQLGGETSHSNLVSTIASSSFAPPPNATGITVVETPSKKQAVDDPSKVEQEIDDALAAVRAKSARRGAVVWALVLAVLALGGALAWQLTSG